MSVISSRLMSRVLLAVATALLVGCGLLWALAAQQLGNYLHQPAFNGAAFADFCSASEISGFPFRLKLTCADFRAPLASGKDALVVGAEEVAGVANLWSPEHVTLSFSSPVALRDAKGGFAKLRHDGATLAFVWDDARGLTQAEVNGRALDWRPEVLEAGPAFNVQALRFSAHPSSRDGADSLRVELGVDGLTAPILQNMLGDSRTQRHRGRRRPLSAASAQRQLASGSGGMAPGPGNRAHRQGGMALGRAQRSVRRRAEPR